MLHRLADRRRDLFPVPHVARRHGAAAPRGHLLELLALEPGQRRAGAAGVQPPGGRRADTARGTGDQDPPPRQRARVPPACAPVPGGGGRPRARPAAVDRHRQHLVVPDQHAQLDQLGPARGGAARASASDSSRPAWSSSAARSSSAAARPPGAPHRRGSARPRHESVRPLRRGARGGATRTRSRSCAPRAGSGARCPRAAACRRASAAREPQPAAEQAAMPRQRREQVRRTVVRLARPIARVISMLTRPISRGARTDPGPLIRPPRSSRAT